MARPGRTALQGGEHANGTPQGCADPEVMPPSAKATHLENSTSTIVVLSLSENRESERRSKTTFEEISNDELLLTKSKEWEYEAEWRILDSLYSADGERTKETPYLWPFKFNPKAIKEIIAGCRSGDLLQKIEAILEQPRYNHLTLPSWYKEW